MDNESRETLRRIVQSTSVGALGTTGKDRPLVSMVPVALDDGRILVHVSGLAVHSTQMRDDPRVSVMLMQPQQPGASALALPRITIAPSAREIAKNTDDWSGAKSTYLRRHPAAEMLFGFGDFALFELEIESARFVAGFGAAFDVSVDEIREALADLLPQDPL